MSDYRCAYGSYSLILDRKAVLVLGSSSAAAARCASRVLTSSDVVHPRYPDTLIMAKPPVSNIPFPVQPRRAFSAQDRSRLLDPTAQGSREHQRPHSSVNVGNDDEEDDDEWTMLSEDSYRSAVP